MFNVFSSPAAPVDQVFDKEKRDREGGCVPLDFIIIQLIKHWDLKGSLPSKGCQAL